MEDQTNAQPIVTAMVSTDYESYKAYRRDNAGHWWLGRLIWVAGAIAIAFFAGYAVSSYFADVLPGIVDREKCYRTIVIVLSVLPAGILIETIRALIAARPRKMFNEHRVVMEMEKQYTFFENYLTLQMPHVYDMVEYANYPEAKECKAAFYLKSSVEGHIQLPKKCFTEEQITALRDLFARKFEKKFKQYDQK